MAILLSETNRLLEATGRFCEALARYSSLEKAKLDAYANEVKAVISGCNDLATQLVKTQRVAEAANFYREALASYRRLAKANLDALGADVGKSCNHLAELLEQTGHPDDAAAYRKLAREIFDRL